MNTQEKLEFLAADVMRDINMLVQKVERASKELDGTKTAISKNTEKLLLEATTSIQEAADAITSTECRQTEAAAHVAHQVLGGVEKQLNNLVAEQNKALAWINRAAEFYEKTFVLRPIILSSLVGGGIGGIIVGIIVAIFI